MVYHRILNIVPCAKLVYFLLHQLQVLACADPLEQGF